MRTQGWQLLVSPKLRIGDFRSPPMAKKLFALEGRGEKAGELVDMRTCTEVNIVLFPPCT